MVTYLVQTLCTALEAAAGKVAGSWFSRTQMYSPTFNVAKSG